VGDREEVTELLKLPFDFIFFTGSTKVGKIVMKAAAENLTPVLLELGGQNPALVDETANIADAAKKIVWGAMAWGGQWCTSPGYAYVHESISDAFVAEAKKAVLDLYGPDPRANPDHSRVISAREVSRLSNSRSNFARGAWALCKSEMACLRIACTVSMQRSAISVADRFLGDFFFSARVSSNFAFGTAATAGLPHSVRLIRMASASFKGRVDAPFAAAAFISRDAVVRCQNPSTSALVRSHGTHSP
jgi:Aldehyde dehydrogenase family